ncbi:MAG: putative quinol monooxygenase [Lentihominibacter sp.]|jgi:quinol monooxygenase YgiN
MITSITVLTVPKENKGKFISMCEELVKKTREEEGCIDFDIYEDVEKDTEVAFIERWKDVRAIEIHCQMEFFGRIVPKIMELCEGDPILAEKYKECYPVK